MFHYILIVGFGFSGQSLAKYLEKKNITYAVYDDRTHKYIEDFSVFDAVFLSPGIKKSSFNRHKIFDIINQFMIPIVNDIDILRYFKPNSILIGITGTAGKTTTAYLTSFLLDRGGVKNKLCGNMGIDIFDDNYDVFVVEVGAAQLETFNSYFDIAVLTNIRNDHLDFFYHPAIYSACKFRIFNKSSKKQYFFSHYPLPIETEKLISTENIKMNLAGCNIQEDLQKQHNLENISLALGVCSTFNIGIDILRSLSAFNLPKFRQEKIYEDSYNLIINDSKCTNILSLESALNSCYGKIYLLCGGKLKNKEPISFNCENIVKIICFGADRDYFFNFANVKNIETERFTSFFEISECLKNILKIQEKKTILFSPVGQSFDEFKSYQERGEAFNNIVKKITQKL